jgi:hypothetical protein
VDIVLGQLWNLFISLIVLSLVFYGLCMMVGQKNWAGKTIGKAWKWLFLAPFRFIGWVWRQIFSKKKKSSGGGGHRGHTT